MCLPSCVNPSAGLHHHQCVNFTPPPNFYEAQQKLKEEVQRMRERLDEITKQQEMITNEAKITEEDYTARVPFYELKDVIRTFQSYMYSIYSLQRQHGFVQWMRHDMLLNSKSVLIFEYDKNNVDHATLLYFKHMNPSVLQIANARSPCVILEMVVDGVLKTMVMGHGNVYDGFIKHLTIKHRRRCDICLQKARRFVVCFRCEHRYCVDCFDKINKMTCPFCNYTLTDHENYLNDLYMVE